MTFLEWSMLGGLAAVAIPIVLHLLKQRQVRSVIWGAMHFLFGSMQRRRRRILLEELLVLILRCLILALVVVAMARPLAPPDGGLSWGLSVLALLLGAMAAAATATLRDYPRWRWGLGAAAALLVAFALLAPVLTGRIHSNRALANGGRDVAIVIDGSGSMALRNNGRSGFERAIEKAHDTLGLLHRADAAGIILAGATARRVTPAPVYEHEDLAAILDELSPSQGSLDIPAAIETAAAMLEGGRNSLKQIIVFSDAQAAAWQPENLSRWQRVNARLWRLAPDKHPEPGRTPPVRVISVVVTPPEDIRNLTALDITPLRTLAGSDRPTGLRVTVRNTGTQAAGPARVILKADDAPSQEAQIGLLEPGQTAAASFVHQFEAGGAHALLARVDFDDDLPGDNECARVLVVPEPVPVLVIEGSPAVRPLDGAAVFVTTALNPPAAPEEPPPDKTPVQNTDKSGGLVRPTVLSIADLSRAAALETYSLVVMADAPRLPPDFADKVAHYVSEGGNLIIIAGARAQPSFYDAWRTASGQSITGVGFNEFRTGLDSGDGARPNLESFTHPALARVADPRHSDLNLAVIHAYWRLTLKPTSKARVAAALNTGDPLLVENYAERGRVLTFATALDRSAGNLPLRSSFVPLVLGLVYDMLASDEQPVMNGVSDTSLQRRLPLRDSGEAQTGLRGEIFSDTAFLNSAGIRMQPDMTPPPSPPVAGMPRKGGFSVRWSGLLIPTVSGVHTFSLYSIDQAGLQVDRETVIPLGSRFGSGKIKLTADQPVDFQCDYVYLGGHRSLRLEWEAPGLPRQIVPKDRFLPQRSLTRALEGQLGKATGPAGERLTVALSGGGDTLVVRGGFSTVPGIYRLSLPENAASRVGKAWQGTFPIAVRPTADETPVTRLSANDEGLLSRRIDLHLPLSREDLAAVMTGDRVGREFGAHLLLAAVLAALLEVALARWIAVRRGIATTHAPEFQESISKTKPTT